ncbi:unnamed protein product [Moneuplotes crassus]|uniref:DNA replication complex GINS protein SLD5 n=1 Tax=Euplotes crassus TaxID=5936 RepID=A0AAD1XTU9_EUPCR|nr:unnamed protein product [Moneuplotes crassus]
MEAKEETKKEQEEVKGADLDYGDEPEGENPLIKKMIKIILKEREIPEILPYEEETVSELDTIVKEQEEAVSEQETRTANENFFVMIYKTEIERLKFLLKTYLRTRLFKIQKYYLYIIKHEKADLLSKAEYNFVANYFLYKRNHFKECFTKDLYDSLNDFVEIKEEDAVPHKNAPVSEDLVVQPSLKRPVFIKMNCDMPRVNDFVMETKENLKMGEIMLVPYDNCKDLIEANVAEIV